MDVDDDVLKELFDEDWEDARSFIDGHNGRVLVEDWEAPYCMDVFVMYEGQPMGVRIFNDAYDDDLLIDPVDLINAMVDGLVEFTSEEDSEED